MAGNEAPFLPSRREIEMRAEIMLWMGMMGWDESIIDSVMMLDHPDIPTVRKLVYRWGPDEALRRIQVFLQ